jgi:hypothetical protein
MKLLKYKWFSAVEWQWQYVNVMAESQEQAEAFIRKESSVDFVPYNGNKKEDSLELLAEEDMTIPGFTGPIIDGDE